MQKFKFQYQFEGNGLQHIFRQTGRHSDEN